MAELRTEKEMESTWKMAKEELFKCSAQSALVRRCLAPCAADSESIFFQTSSAFGDPLDLSDHPLLLDIFFLGPPQLRTGLGFLFFLKVSFEKHPSVRISIHLDLLQ